MICERPHHVLSLCCFAELDLKTHLNPLKLQSCKGQNDANSTLNVNQYHVFRSFIGFVVILLDIVQNEAFYRVTKIRKKFPQGCSFQSTSETTIGNCFAKCLENCTCRAFWMFDKDKTCSLYLSHNISLKMEDKMEGCSYFIFERNQKPGCKVWFH